MVIEPNSDSVRTLHLKGGNDYAEAMNKLDPVRAMARDPGCHITGTYHAKKSRGAGGDEVLGSTGPARDEATKQLVLRCLH